LNYDVGLFAQDSWKVRRLAVNYGLRVEGVRASADAQDAPAGRFVGERHFAAVDDLPKFGPDVAPRLGLAYDLFGDAKTALKFSLGKYYRRHTVTFVERLSPMAPVTVAIPWNDRDLQGRNLSTNGDGIAENNEIDLTRLPANFGQRPLDTLDPNIKREYNVETGLTLQHEIGQRVSVSAGWYHRSFYNLYVDVSTQRGFDDYVPVQVVSPYNGEVITAYNLKSPALLPLVNQTVTNGANNRQIYNGFEYSAQGRLPGGGMLLVSSTIQRTLTKSCDAGSAAAIPDAPRGNASDPNNLRFCDRFNLPAAYSVPFRSDFKLAGSYPLPWWGIGVSATFTSEPGRPTTNLVNVDELLPINWLVTPTTRYTAAQCEGRPCTAGALVIPGMVESQLVIPLVPAGTVRFMERQNQLNLGVRKTFRTGGIEYSAEFNLYNALNADTVTGILSVGGTVGLTTGGPYYGTSAYNVPSSVLPGRMPRVALRVNW